MRIRVIDRVRLGAGLVAFVAFVATSLVGGEVSATPSGDGAISVGEVQQPPSSFGVDAAVLRAAAEGEIRQMREELTDAKAAARRHVVVSLALTKTMASPAACTVSATLRDARTGTMISIIESRAHSTAPVSNEIRRQVAHAAVQSAIRKIPSALQ